MLKPVHSAVGGAAAATCGLIAAIVCNHGHAAPAPPQPARHASQAVQPFAPPGAPTVAPVTYEQLDPLAAVEWNRAVPIQRAGPAAARFFLAKGTPVWDAASRCLAQAVYYEAASEPVAGKRAVAQVVLNRVRSPAFPNTICGVVYQGSERSTGCQFTFTCDGSLRHDPSSKGWQSALDIAQAALQGSVYAPIGNATHYHANYVVPYWAPTMAKIGQIGAHLFYRWPGTWPASRYFGQQYANAEPAPFLAPAPVQLADAAPGDVAAGPQAAGSAMQSASSTTPKPRSALAVDQIPHVLAVADSQVGLRPELNRVNVLAADVQASRTPTMPKGPGEVLR